jgi:hypothetical protein
MKLKKYPNALFVLAYFALALCAGCATQNLADNPVNRTAGVIASALAGVNRSVASGLDSADKTLMNVQYKSANSLNEYVLAATLGTRRETGIGPNPDATYRPALTSKANEICKGQFSLLAEENRQASAAFQRERTRQRIEREALAKTGRGGYRVPDITTTDYQLLNTYPEAGLTWLVRCGEGKGWAAPALPKLDLTTAPAQDREFIARTAQNTARIVASVPSLSVAIYPKALVLVPDEIALKGLILDGGKANPQTKVLIWGIGLDGLARAVQRRNIFNDVDIQEASRLPDASDGKVVIYFSGENINVRAVGEPTQVIPLNPESYTKYVGPRVSRSFQQEEGIELALFVAEDAARRSAARLKAGG